LDRIKPVNQVKIISQHRSELFRSPPTGGVRSNLGEVKGERDTLSFLGHAQVDRGMGGFRGRSQKKKNGNKKGGHLSLGDQTRGAWKRGRAPSKGGVKCHVWVSSVFRVGHFGGGREGFSGGGWVKARGYSSKKIREKKKRLPNFPRDSRGDFKPNTTREGR